MQHEKAMKEFTCINAAATLLQQDYPSIQGSDIKAALAQYYGNKGQSAQKKNEPSRLLTLKEAASRLSVSLPTLHRLLRRGLLNRFKTSGKLVRIPEASVDKLIEAWTVANPASIGENNVANCNISEEAQNEEGGHNV